MRPFARTFNWGIVLYAALALVTIFSPIGCSKKQPEAIKIGAIMPLTGELATAGQAVKEGMDLAIGEINTAGGIEGKPLKIIFEDDLGQPTVAVSAFNKLIDTQKVPIILGPLTSGASMATAPVAEKRKVVQLSTLAGTIQLKYAGDYVFRVFASDELQGAALVDKAADVFKAKNAAILYINNAYGSGMKQVVEEGSKKRGIEILASESFNEGDSDFRGQLLKIKNCNPQLVFALSYWKEGALILVQAKELGMTVTFLGGDAWSGPISKVAGDAVELLVFSSMAFGKEYAEYPQMQRFIRSFAEKYGKEASAFAATGFDAVYLAANAIKKGGYDSSGIKKALYETKGFIGSLGEITFDEYGDNVGAKFDLYVMRNNKTVRYLETKKR